MRMSLKPIVCPLNEANATKAFSHWQCDYTKIQLVLSRNPGTSCQVVVLQCFRVTGSFFDQQLGSLKDVPR